MKSVRKIRERANSLRNISDNDLVQKSLEQRFEAKSGVKPTKLAVDCFPLVMEASRRQLGLVHYDVQVLCALEMAKGRITEMKTGEGKTLTATLIASLFGMTGRGMHVVTFNDYLATRDCDTLRSVYESLGLTVGALKENMPDEERKLAYAADITYGSAKEFGFDFLRDRLKMASPQKRKSVVMRGTNYALIDEADSIMLDEARTPLIIGLANESEDKIVEKCYRWAAKHGKNFAEEVDFKYNQVKNTVKLTSNGIRKLRSLPENAGTKQVSIRQLYDYIQNAIKVHRDFHLDKTYAIVEDDILIIDEFTGRPAEGRQWQGGIHQAVQAKEGLDITAPTRQAATVTVQTFFKLYKFFCGMTGTAWTARREFKRIYKKAVTKIPTHLPAVRIQHPTQVFHDSQQKFRAVVETTRKLTSQNRAVLIGTRSVDKSERLASQFEAAGIPHVVLNAKNLPQEAEIVADAGQPKRVTIATNMAGRGTDIKLHEDVKTAGGLHVILTEIHESSRIDWQLIGRGSRQGEPGSYQIFVSLDDEILVVGRGAKPVGKMRKKLAGRKLDPVSVFKIFKHAQRKIERRHLTDRLMTMKRDTERQKSLFATGEDPYLNVLS